MSVSTPTLPSDQLPTVAMPLAFVLGVAPVTVPLPAVAANVTVTPAFGLPNASFTITAGAVGKRRARRGGLAVAGLLGDAGGRARRFRSR